MHCMRTPTRLRALWHCYDVCAPSGLSEYLEWHLASLAQIHTQIQNNKAARTLEAKASRKTEEPWRKRSRKKRLKRKPKTQVWTRQNQQANKLEDNQVDSPFRLLLRTLISSRRAVDSQSSPLPSTALRNIWWESKTKLDGISRWTEWNAVNLPIPKIG